MNKLYVGIDGLEVMEAQEDSSFDFIYLDPPYNTGNAFSSNDIEIDGYKSIRHYLAEKKNVKVGEITLDEVNAERERQDKLQDNKYNSYISKLIQNSARIVKDNGILAFLAPGKEFTDINYKLVLDQFFLSSTKIVIERRQRINSSRGADNTSILYFYSKEKGYQFPVLEECRPVEEFRNKDDYDYYNTTSLTNAFSGRNDYFFEWKGITPAKGWRYKKEKLDELFDSGRIIIKDGRAFLKMYRSEHPVTVSDVWDADSNERFGCSLDSRSIERMVSLYIQKDTKVFCPFERDGKLSSYLDNIGADWTSAYCARDSRDDFISSIPTEHYVTSKVIAASKPRHYVDNVIANASDIADLRAKFKKLSSAMVKIQESFGIMSGEEDEIADNIISQIQLLFEQSIPKASVEDSVPEAKSWINPFWDSLEPESKHFIPTGVLLYNQFSEDPDLDMAPIMIEYCKTLERELFKKMFYGYIESLIEKHIDIQAEYGEAFGIRKTAVFAHFLNDSTTANKDNPECWKLEIGKMVFVLRETLKRPKERIFIDFRRYLDDTFAQQFFNSEFIVQLGKITDLRNDCAHPSMIDNSVVEEGKELIRKKLLLILENYKE